MVGVAIPLPAGRKRRRLLTTESGFFALAKAFTAGVILATGFVHMLHDAEAALTDPCLLRFPWRPFPFSGFITMAAALATLVLDFLATQFYERKHRAAAAAETDATAAARPTPRQRTTRSAPSSRRRRSHLWMRTRTRAPPKAAMRCTSSGCARTRRRTATATTTTATPTATRTGTRTGTGTGTRARFPRTCATSSSPKCSI
uniref:Uncharacterized protein n=1 Tax=Ananas comosus var. bracteatus TaxID=296719 RepID=A0A6V7Q8K0_ANACO|nr:unnamed protein product [Ananas comosus var. bracteatus]